MKQNVAAMEYYAAEDRRPADVCIQDVKASDIYVGIFAWRYGSTVPWGDPPQPISITELEYRAAAERKRLIFLADGAVWPKKHRDTVSGENDRGAKIAGLRKELGQSHMAKFFTTPDQLALQVTLSLFQELTLDKPKKFDLPERLTEMQDIKQFGSSLIKEIDEKVRQAAKDVKGAKYIEVNLGKGKSWWSTRLYLLASLAFDYTQIRRIVFVDGEKRLIGMASPLAVKRALWAEHRRLRPLYQEAAHGGDAEAAIVSAIMSFRQQLKKSRIPEPELKVFVTVGKLKDWLKSGLEQGSVSTDAETEQNVFLAYQVIKEPAEFVAVSQRDGKLLRHDIATAWGSKVGEQGLQSTSPRHIIADETIWQNESM
jgi:hypothetical protein